jgi:hypothetical protein
MIDNRTFSDQTIYSTGLGSLPRSLAVVDFDNDNHRDIVIANSNADNIDVFLGYGNGSFSGQMVNRSLLHLFSKLNRRLEIKSTLFLLFY